MTLYASDTNLVASIMNFVPSAATIKLLSVIYVSIEFIFYLVFRYYLVPRANERVPAPPYRHFEHGDRHLLFLRLLNRVERTGLLCSDNAKLFFAKFLMSWFHPLGTIPEEATTPSGMFTSNNNNRTISKTVDSSDGPLSLPPPMWRCSMSSLSTNATRSASSSDTASLSDRSSDSSTSLTPCASEEVALPPNEVHEEVPRHHSIIDLGNGKWTLDGVIRPQVEGFLSWAFFSHKKACELVEWEQREMQQCLDMVEERFNFTFLEEDEMEQHLEKTNNHQNEPGVKARRYPRILSVEKLNPLHRPLLIYLMVIAVKFFAGIFLRLLGFTRVATRSGLVGWVRRARPTPTAQAMQPLLFFHGIAPGGFVAYLPMLLMGLAKDGRGIVLFENSNISCALGFDIVNEAAHAAGVREIVEEYFDKGVASEEEKCKLAVAGHSFGSVPVTWMVHDPWIRQRLGQIILLDPVTLLISEPAVMNNFLYGEDGATNRNHNTEPGDDDDDSENLGESVHGGGGLRGGIGVGTDKIRLVAASELFTEYYLRRHFIWYNSELWLEDVPADVPVVLALSAQDEIVDASAVRQHALQYNLDQHNATKGGDAVRDAVLENEEVAQEPRVPVNLIYWEDASHAMCLTSADKWGHIRQAVLEEELKQAQQKKQ